MTEFHGDVYGVGDDGDSFPMPNATSQKCGGSAGADGDRLVVGDEAGRRQTDTSLFNHAFLLLLLERREMPKRFIKHRHHRRRATVVPTKLALLLQFAQIAPDRRGGNMEMAG